MGRTMVTLAIAVGAAATTQTGGSMGPERARAPGGQEAPEPAELTAGDFATLAWLEGRWVGSGGGYDAFYEAYRFVNDSTIEQTTYPDDSFAEPDGVSTIRFREGRALKWRDGEAESMIARLAGDTLRFERIPPRPGGFTWIHVSDDEWRAILDRPRGEPPVVYTLRRIR